MGFMDGMFGQPKIKDGLSGTATVMAVPQAGANASSYRIQMKLSVQLPGQDPYLVRYTCFASREKYPWPGSVVPVTVDRKDREKLRIEWDRVPTSDERAAQSHEQMIAMQKGTPVAGSPGIGTVIDARNNPELRAEILAALSNQGIDVSGASGDATTPSAGGQDDTLDQLQQLGHLRDSGVLTPEEFESQKSRILGK